MSNVRCLQVFLHAVKHDEPELARALGSESFDPDEFYAFARRHAVAGYFYALLKDAGLLRLLPGGLDARLREVHEIQAAKADRLLPEIHRLRQRFERAGLDVIFIKGPFLSKRFYGDPGFRGSVEDLGHGSGLDTAPSRLPARFPATCFQLAAIRRLGEGRPDGAHRFPPVVW